MEARHALDSFADLGNQVLTERRVNGRSWRASRTTTVDQTRRDAFSEETNQWRNEAATRIRIGFRMHQVAGATRLRTRQ